MHPSETAPTAVSIALPATFARAFSGAFGVWLMPGQALDRERLATHDDAGQVAQHMVGDLCR
jgi:hypothetical protein